MTGLIKTARGFGRRVLGVLALLAATVVVWPAAVLTAVYTLLTAPLKLRIGRLRRAVAIAAVYTGIEITGLALAAWQWVRYVLDRDDARDRRDRIRLLNRSLNVLRAAAHRFGRLDVMVMQPAEAKTGEAKTGEANGAEGTVRDAGSLALPAGPLIVCGRHGGVGGAFLLAHILLAGYGRLPRVVLKQTLSWDPLIDALLSRIPHAFIDPQPGDQGQTASRIGVLAEGMAGDDALLIFPEGGNFSPQRRTRAIRRLRRRGLAKAAARAERLRNVLPPHPDGLLAAIEAAPEADVVFVAHTGLEHVQSAIDMWRALPLRLPVVFTWWTVPGAEVPREDAARVGWLEENWSRIDRWVSAARTV